MQLSSDLVIYFRERLIREFGGLAAVPDVGRVEGVIGRVEQAVFYADPAPDVYELAALYWAAFAVGHVFSDGNKRTALTVMLYCLSEHNIQLYYSREIENQLIDLTVEAATGAQTVTSLAEILREMPQSQLD